LTEGSTCPVDVPENEVCFAATKRPADPARMASGLVGKKWNSS
jgi:hypothetical protein